METPLPCPFCGSIPFVGPADPEMEGDACGYVECKNPDCPAKPCVTDDEEIIDNRGSDGYKEIAIRRWNKRI